VDVPTHDRAVLVLVPGDTPAPDRTAAAGSPAAEPPDAILIQHAATVVALQMSQALMALEHRRRAGAELLGQLMDNRIDPHSGGRQLRAARLEPGHCVLVNAACPDDTRLLELHVTLWRHAVPHVVMLRSGVAHALVPDGSAAERAVLDGVGEDGRIGVSGPLGSADRAGEAAREAGWALRIAERNGIARARYGQAVPWSGIPNVDEAQALVERTLRPLLDHDRKHGSELIPTLRTFLAQRRSWQRTARELHLHRQTVLYRIHRIEEIIGRDLSETGDLAEIWLGLQALDLLNP